MASTQLLDWHWEDPTCGLESSLWRWIFIFLHSINSLNGGNHKTCNLSYLNYLVNVWDTQNPRWDIVIHRYKNSWMIGWLDDTKFLTSLILSWLWLVICTGNHGVFFTIPRPSIYSSNITHKNSFTKNKSDFGYHKYKNGNCPKAATVREKNTRKWHPNLKCLFVIFNLSNSSDCKYIFVLHTI